MKKVINKKQKNDIWHKCVFVMEWFKSEMEQLHI